MANFGKCKNKFRRRRVNATRSVWPGLEGGESSHRRHPCGPDAGAAHVLCVVDINSSPRRTVQRHPGQVVPVRLALREKRHHYGKRNPFAKTCRHHHFHPKISYASKANRICVPSSASVELVLNPVTHLFMFQKGQDSIGLHCVNETTDIIPCSSGSFTLNQQIVWEARGSDPKVEVFTPGLHHFELVPDLFTRR